MISTSALTAMRATQTAALPDTCTVKRPPANVTGAIATVATGVACRIAPPSNRTIIAAPFGFQEEVPDAVGTFSATQDIRQNDQITVGSTTYRVGATNAGESNRTALRANLHLM